MISKTQNINKTQLIANFNRAASRYHLATDIPFEIGKRLFERLDYIRLQPKQIIDLGSATGHMSRLLEKRYPKATIFAVDIASNMLKEARRRASWRHRQMFIAADAYQLPFADQSIDFIFSNLMLACCPNIETIFLECRRVLKPEGLLLFSTIGPDTLLELRQTWATLDDTAHVHSFLDMHDIGDSLVKAHFTDPVIDMEKISLTYSDLTRLLQDLKALGAHNLASNRHKGLTAPTKLQQLIKGYEVYRNQEGLLSATLEVVYGHAWGPIAATPNAAGEVFIPVSQIKRRHI